MRYTVAMYARALTEALREKPSEGEAIGKRFLRLLTRNGDLRSAKKILHEAERIAIASAGGRRVEVVGARPLAEKQEKEIRNRFEARDHVVFRVDPSLIAGVRITIDGEQMIDATMKRKLEKLFMK